MSEKLKYKKISDFFLTEIKSGKYETGKRLPSERALAKKYNLAHMTVNKALNGLVATGHLERRRGDGTYINEKTPPKTACLVLDYMDDIHSMFPYILQKALFEAGYIVTVFDTYRISRNQETLGAYLSNYPELLIIDGLSAFPFELLKNIPASTKLIFLQRCEAEPVFDASYVLVDIEQCGYLAAKQLIGCGKKRLALISEQRHNEYDEPTLFIRGAAKAAGEQGLEIATIIEHEVCRDENQVDISFSEAMKLLCDRNRPDGIMAFADCELTAISKAAKALSISIPGDLALVGRCNTPWAKEFDLTSLDIQPEKIIEHIKGTLNSKDNTSILVPPRIIFRNSCPPAEIYSSPAGKIK